MIVTWIQLIPDSNFNVIFGLCAFINLNMLSHLLWPIILVPVLFLINLSSHDQKSDCICTSFHLHCTLIAPFIPALSLCLANSPNTNTANTVHAQRCDGRASPSGPLGWLCVDSGVAVVGLMIHTHCSACWRVSTHRSASHAHLAGGCLVWGHRKVQSVLQIHE